jgi:PadR family transcriptional regulator AphA
MALRHVVLTVLARGHKTGYEITKSFETVYSHFWRASHQQVYRELGRLSAEGRVNAKLVAQEGKPDKKIYSITKRGLEELRQWIVAPTEVPRSQYDLLVKLLGCNITGREDFRPELDRIRAMAQDWLRMLREMRRECLRQREKGWSEHEEVLYLALRRGLLLGEAQMRWLNEVDAYLRSGKLPSLSAIPEAPTL